MSGPEEPNEEAPAEGVDTVRRKSTMNDCRSCITHFFPLQDDATDSGGLPYRHKVGADCLPEPSAHAVSVAI